MTCEWAISLSTGPVVVETEGVHLEACEDTEYSSARSSTSAPSTPGGPTGPSPSAAMRDKVVRFEAVDEDGWRERLAGMFRGVG